MAYNPRSSAEILRDLVAGVVARSELTDIAEGSVLSHLLSSVAIEMASAEFRMARIRDSFFLDVVTGGDLDDRVAELPPSGLSRLPPTAASGGGLTLTREAANVANQLALPRGAMFSRSDDPSVFYVTVEDQVFAANEAVIRDVTVRCVTPGLQGNCPVGTIDTIVSAPPSILSVSQAAPCAGGSPPETDDQLRSRAKAYLTSLARCQPTAIEHAVRSFIASDSTRVQYASLWEDPNRRGYSEVVIDDGSAFQGIDRPGRTVNGVVPRGGITILSHEAPAIQPITKVRRWQNVNNAWVEQAHITPDQFVSVPERGIIYITDNSAFDAGDKWEVGRQGVDDASQYRIYGGVLIPELQRLIEGDLDDPSNAPGLRAAGTRVRIVPPSVQLTSVDAHVVPVNGVSFVTVAREVEISVIEFVGNLRPGEPLIVAKLIDRLMNNQDLENVHLYEGQSDPPVRLEDGYPSSPRHVLRTTEDLVRIVPPVEL